MMASLRVERVVFCQLAGGMPEGGVPFDRRELLRASLPLWFRWLVDGGAGVMRMPQSSFGWAMEALWWLCGVAAAPAAWWTPCGSALVATGPALDGWDCSGGEI
jgi:hypothetical protein